MKNFMMTSRTDWITIDQMSKLTASDRKLSPCTCSAAVKLLESAGFIACCNATFSRHFQILGHSMVIMHDAPHGGCREESSI